MQEQTVEQWSGVLADLAAKRQQAQEHVARLRAEKQNLALEAAMGGGDAQKKLAKVNAELARLDLEGDDWDAAIAQAEQAKRKAEQAAADSAERDRRARIGTALTTYMQSVADIDAAMQILSQRFGEAAQSLDRAEALMNGPERAPVQQLQSLWGATLAAANCGLGAFIALGQESSHLVHRQPLAAYIKPFVDPWIESASGDGKE